MLSCVKGRQSSLHRVGNANDRLGGPHDRSARRIFARGKGQQARRWRYTGHCIPLLIYLTNQSQTQLHNNNWMII